MSRCPDCNSVPSDSDEVERLSPKPSASDIRAESRNPTANRCCRRNSSDVASRGHVLCELGRSVGRRRNQRRVRELVQQLLLGQFPRQTTFEFRVTVGVGIGVVAAESVSDHCKQCRRHFPAHGRRGPKKCGDGASEVQQTCRTLCRRRRPCRRNGNVKASSRDPLGAFQPAPTRYPKFQPSPSILSSTNGWTNLEAVRQRETDSVSSPHVRWGRQRDNFDADFLSDGCRPSTLFGPLSTAFGLLRFKLRSLSGDRRKLTLESFQSCSCSRHHCYCHCQLPCAPPPCQRVRFTSDVVDFADLTIVTKMNFRRMTSSTPTTKNSSTIETTTKWNCSSTKMKIYGNEH